MRVVHFVSKIYESVPGKRWAEERRSSAAAEGTAGAAAAVAAKGFG